MHIYQFDAFAFKTQNLMLTKGEEDLGIRPKAALLLLALLEHPKQLLSKEVLLHSVWQDCHVSDAVLFQTMAELRRILGTHSRDCKFIRNLKGQGYLWIYEPLHVTYVALEPPDTPDASEPPPANPDPPPKRPRRLRVLLTAGFAALALFASLFLLLPHRPELSERRTQLNLRVLPFRDETGLVEVADLAPALAELVAWQLAKHGQVLTDLSALPRPEEGLMSPHSLLAKNHCLAVLSGRFHLLNGRPVLTVSLSALEFPTWEQTFYGTTAWDCVRALNRALAMRLRIPPPTTTDPFVTEGTARLFAAGERARQAIAPQIAMAAYQRALLEQPDHDLFRLNLALALARLGHPHRAQALAQEALAHAELLGSQSLIRACFETLAQLEHERGDLPRMIAYRHRILTASQRWGVPTRLVDLIALASAQTTVGAWADAKATLASAATPLTLERASAYTARLELIYYHCCLELGEQVQSNLNALEDSFRLEARHHGALQAQVLACWRALHRDDQAQLTQLLTQLLDNEAHELDSLSLELHDLAAAMQQQGYHRSCLTLLESMQATSRCQTAYGRARMALARCPSLLALGNRDEAAAELALCAQFLAATEEPEQALGFGQFDLERLRQAFTAQP